MGWSRKHRHWGRYHHGNLKEALIEAARALVAELGPQGFSLAETARRAGVSAAAPYRHFSDRDALMQEVARRGYATLATRLDVAWDGGKPAPLTAFQRMGAAYLTFAAEDPAAYGAMFLSGQSPAEPPALREAADRAFAVLVSAAAKLGCRHSNGSLADPRQIALHIWALSHGLATLCGRHSVKGIMTLPEAQRLLESGAATYLAGLNVPGANRS
jgi:AcrR family transcriptional regulator